MMEMDGMPANPQRCAELDAAQSLLALKARAANGVHWRAACRELRFRAHDGPFQLYVPIADAQKPCPWCADRFLWYKRVLMLPKGKVRCSLCRLDC